MKVIFNLQNSRVRKNIFKKFLLEELYKAMVTILESHLNSSYVTDSQNWVKGLFGLRVIKYLCRDREM